ncbi:MAG: DEAD/DEAH box helicase [Candidatus Omnitrophica bacterium]|nr:DEAD/DEAH box helicase [Candidatus Omnitrophota bacterium]
MSTYALFELKCDSASGHSLQKEEERMTDPNQHTFFGLGIAPKLLESLERMKFKTPTPIQHKAIPIGIEGKDLMGVAQTGTGKTLAFAIPMVQRLAQSKGIGLVLVPTRELALQVEETVRKVAQPFGMFSAVLIGGASMEEQVRAVRRNPRVIIATPGRLIDHVTIRRSLKLDAVNVLVLDEADRMLDMGFAPQIEEILRYVPRERQTMLFSATMPREIMSMASRHMKLPVNVEVAPSGTTVEKIVQELFIIRKEAKLALLEKVLTQYRGSVLLFIRTKHHASRLSRDLKKMGHSAAEIHSDRSLGQRKAALEGFKVGRFRILVATDIASRGIDVKGIELVINYDLPDDAENYVHRIGRTGRAGMEGRAISFATPDQFGVVTEIQRLIRADIPVAKHPEVQTEEFLLPTRSVHAPAGGGQKRFMGRSFRSRGSRFRRK